MKIDVSKIIEKLKTIRVPKFSGVDVSQLSNANFEFVKEENFKTRLRSAAILAIATLGIVYAGGSLMVLLALAVGLALVYEWNALTTSEQPMAGKLVMYALLGLAIGYGAADEALDNLLVVLALAVAIMAGITLIGGPAFRWTVWGSAYIAFPVASFLWLRGLPEGKTLSFLMLFYIWATDIGAYLAGRSIGGAKLAPAISPNKTWAGLFGGMACAAVVGFLAGIVTNLNASAFLLAFTGALIAVVGQAGDISESWVKRHFGVKDSGNLIPGHGGLLDRLDGFLAACPFFCLIIWMAGLTK